METQTKINWTGGVLILAIVAYTVINGIEPNYYCEARDMKLEYCTNLTKYYSLDNGKCLSPFGNKLCRSGWEEIFFKEPEITQDYTDSKGKWDCRPNGCEAIDGKW